MLATKAVTDALELRIHTLETQGVPGVRDFFATSALSVLGNNDTADALPCKYIAEYCYEIADAMMEERKKHIGTTNPK